MSTAAEIRAANLLRQMVFAKLEATSADQVGCPRDRSGEGPCIARYGATCLADDGVCVGCGEDPEVLVQEFPISQRLEQEEVE